jgi:hypothetical protein
MADIAAATATPHASREHRVTAKPFEFKMPK